MISNFIESSPLLVKCTWKLFILFLCVYYQLNKTVTWFKTISQSHVSGQKELAGRLLGHITTDVLKKSIQMISLADQVFFVVVVDFFSTLVVTAENYFKQHEKIQQRQNVPSGIHCNILHKYSELLPIRQSNIPTLLNSGMPV